MGFIRDSFGRVCVESRRESFILHVDHGGAPGPSPEFLTADLDDVIAALSDYRASLPNAGRAAATPDPPADRDTPDGCRAPHCWSEYGTPCGTCPAEKPETP